MSRITIRSLQGVWAGCKTSVLKDQMQRDVQKYAQTGDVQLSTALSLAMQAIDPTGQLPLMGQSYALTPPPDISVPYSTKTTVGFGFKFGMPYLKIPRNMTGSLEPSADGDMLPSPSSSACSSATTADRNIQRHSTDLWAMPPHQR